MHGIRLTALNSVFHKLTQISLESETYKSNNDYLYPGITYGVNNGEKTITLAYNWACIFTDVINLRDIIYGIFTAYREHIYALN